MTTEARHPAAETRTSERGFTLIELSIVLVIIGLLIGGILQGQEMINNTRLKTQVAQVDAIQASVQTFADKYRALPGDYAAAVANIGAANNGSGDGIIQNAGSPDTAAALSAAVGLESGYAWDHLKTSNILAGVASDNTLPGKMAQSLLDIQTFNFLATNGTTQTSVPAVGVRVRGVAGATAGVYNAVDAGSLDDRYDDGVPDRGRWQGVAATNCFTASGAGNSDGDYLGAAAGANGCAMVIRVN